MNRRRLAYIKKLDIIRTKKYLRNRLTEMLMNRLDLCKDDDARRLLLGIKKP